MSQASDFENHMMSVWDGPLSIYLLHKDAALEVKKAGATRLWPSGIEFRGDAFTWQFPDGSRVYVANDGDEVRIPRKRRRKEAA